MFRHRIVAVAAFAAAALVVPGGAGASPNRPTPEAVDVSRLSPAAGATLDWLQRELVAGGGTLPSSYDPTQPDVGLTEDAVLALAAGGRQSTPAAQLALTQIDANADAYITGAPFDSPAARYLGPAAKTALVAEIYGADIHDVGGLDLEATLRDAVQTFGPFAGRFSDQGSDYGDYSNVFGQALAVNALSRTAGGVPAAAVAFLLRQQCPAGGFRLTIDDDAAACTGDGETDTDATSFALQALLTIPAAPGVAAATAGAVNWLEGHQAADGSFSGTGPTASPNANSTGLAAAALRSAGRALPANRAATFVAALQLTAAQVAGGPAAADAGAIAAQQASHDAAVTTGIPAAGRDQVRRASSQGVLGLGLPAYSQIGVQAPLTPPSSALSPLGPVRLLDTRTASFATTVDGQFLGAGVQRSGSVLELTVAGRGGVPAGADAVVLNLTVADTSAAGFVTVYPCGTPRPNASTANFVGDAVEAIAVTAKIGTSGKVCLATEIADTDLIVDVAGYYAPASGVFAVTPARLLDTRAVPYAATVDGTYLGAGAQPAGSTLTLKVAGRGGVPSGVTAVSLNVTAVDAAGSGFVTAHPCGTPVPNASTVNFVADDAHSNAAFVKVAGDGTVCLTTSISPAQLIVDVNGYAVSGAGFDPLAPGRILDTRTVPYAATVDGRFVGSGLRPAGSVLELAVTGRAGVPAGASAAVLNVTVADGAAAGFVTVFPCGTAVPTASNVNFTAGAVEANQVTAKVDAGGNVCLFTGIAATDLVVDVAGYYP